MGYAIFRSWEGAITTFGPLPSWAELLAGVFAASKPPNESASPWTRDGKRGVWFSRSTWILPALIGQWQEEHDEAMPTVWLPDYFCNQSTEPIRRMGIKLNFYPINESLEPAWQRFQDYLGPSGNIDIFVLVHYFGRISDAQAARTFCNSHNAWLIEDAAHLLVPNKGAGEVGDYIFFSPHKMLPVHDGAFLTNGGLNSRPIPSPGMNDISLATIKWLLTRILLKILPPSVHRSRIRRLPGFSYDPAFKRLTTSPKASKVGQRMLSQSIRKIPELVAERKTNAQAWRRQFAKYEPLAVPFFSSKSEGIVPYRFVLRCTDEVTAEAIFRVARRAGIAVETWPDLPPEVLQNPHEHRTAIRLRKTLLFWPVHNEPEELIYLV